MADTFARSFCPYDAIAVAIALALALATHSPAQRPSPSVLHARSLHSLLVQVEQHELRELAALEWRSAAVAKLEVAQAIEVVLAIRLLLLAGTALVEVESSKAELAEMALAPLP